MTLSVSFEYRYTVIGGGRDAELSGALHRPKTITELNTIPRDEYVPVDGLFEISEGVSITHPGDPPDAGTYLGQNSQGIFIERTSGWYFYSNDGSLGGQTVPYNPIEATCFLEGVRLACEDGDRAVEDLNIGDRVRLADGSLSPIRWIGRQTWASLFADALTVLPVRIAAGALGEATPARDLHLSPDHAVLVDGVLIHAGTLVNGTTITRVDRRDLPERFTYFHIELEAHAVVLAEGCPCESFVANVSRARFDNFDQYLALFGEEQPVEELDLPRAKSARQLPRRVIDRLAVRETSLGLRWHNRRAG